MICGLVIALLMAFCIKVQDVRGVIVGGGVLAALSHLMIGPSKLLNLPNTQELVLGGLAVNGLGYGTVTTFLYQ